MHSRARVPALTLALVGLLAGCLGAQGDVLTVGATTSVRDTGLLDALVTAFTDATGVATRAVVGGSGDVAERARRADVDVALLHAPHTERALVADGVAAARAPVMWNAFVLVGPAHDPAGVASARNASDALDRVRGAGALFASRGDGSGTHARELATWAATGAVPRAATDAWYKETGSGQAATLRYANEKGAYAVTDDATWRTLHGTGTLTRLTAFPLDDPALVNPYHVLPVSAEPGAAAFAAWLTGPDGAAVIRAHTDADGAPLFTPGAAPATEEATP